MMYSGTELGLALALDLALGDPAWLPHPIRAIGWWAGEVSRRIGARSKLAGVLLWMLVVLPTAAVVFATPFLAIFWIYAFLAIRGLDHETSLAVAALRNNDLAGARHWISRVVGRDTAHLDETGVLRAAIETMAENLCDAVVAPLFYLACGGPAAMAAYKAVNTLDSMVGYRDEQFREFGWFSARVDDVANFLPARLSAALVWTCALLLPGFEFARSLRVTLRDASSQPSPNSGWPEAAMAGALGVRLGGLNSYRGVESRKAFLGDAEAPLDFSAFGRTRLLHYAASGLMALAVWSVAR